MENIEASVQRAHLKNSIPYLEKEHGYYGSASVTATADVVFEFCKNQENIRRVFQNLPQGVKNFLELNLTNSSESGNQEYRIEWKNKENSIASGTLTLLVKPAYYRKGSVITAEAVFEKINFRDEEPSYLMNVFLKRLKALLETGVIATTEGQPSGRNEMTSKDQKIQ